MITLSNTGKTITVFLDPAQVQQLKSFWPNAERFSLSFAGNNVFIRPTEEGEKGRSLTDPKTKPGVRSLTLDSSAVPNLPTFGKIRFPVFPLDGARLSLPSELPQARPLGPRGSYKRGSASKALVPPKPANALVAASSCLTEQEEAYLALAANGGKPAGNLALRIGGAEHRFNLPDHVLFTLGLQLAEWRL